jgi:hypothetical protein
VSGLQKALIAFKGDHIKSQPKVLVLGINAQTLSRKILRRIRNFSRKPAFGGTPGSPSIVAANFSLRETLVEWLRFTQAEACDCKK